MKNTTVRIPDEVQEALTLSAGRNYRSLHGEILEALRKYARNFAEITSEEKDRLFYGAPNYVELAKIQKEKIKELEQVVSQLEQTIYGMANPEPVAEEPVLEVSQENGNGKHPRKQKA
jgi:CRISPR/Cas system-associated protein Cas10 (large subunit of type III CRISPR-Cas system)